LRHGGVNTNGFKALAAMSGLIVCSSSSTRPNARAPNGFAAVRARRREASLDLSPLT